MRIGNHHIVPLAAAAAVLFTAAVCAWPAEASPPEEVRERVHSHSFHVPVAPGQTLFVTE